MGWTFYNSSGEAMIIDDGGVVKQFVSTQTGAVATGTTQIPNDDTIPQNDEGDEYMTLAITPKHASNRLIIEITLNGDAAAARWLTVALFQDSTAGALAVAREYARGDEPTPVTFSHVMVAGTTSATTFKVRAGTSSASTVTFNGMSAGRMMGGVMASGIRILEVEP
jgi:hypothetical protein